MLKKSFVIFLSVLLILAMSGCSFLSSQTDSEPQKNKFVSGEFNNMRNTGRVIGKITSISDNTVTIEIGEAEGMMSGMPKGDKDFSIPEGMSFPNNKKSDGNNFSRPASGNGDMGKRPGNGQMSQFNLENAEITYTGEIKEYTIPADLQIGEGDYTSLAVGNVIMLRLDESDKVTSVQVIKQS